MTDRDRWLSVEEIADHLGISRETVYRWLDKKRIPAHRVGKLWKFRAPEVDAWVIKGDAKDSSVETSGKQRVAFQDYATEATHEVKGG